MGAAVHFVPVEFQSNCGPERAHVSLCTDENGGQVTAWFRGRQLTWHASMEELSGVPLRELARMTAELLVCESQAHDDQPPAFDLP